MATKSSWDDLTYPKKEGGLGLFKICEWNRAAILMLCFIVRAGSLGSAWVNVYLLKGRSLWARNILANSYWCYRKILQLREVAGPLIIYRAGNGDRITSEAGII